MFRRIIKSYKYVRRKTPLNKWYYNTFVGHFISSRVSPVLTVFFIKRHTPPNTITIYMILSGIIGATLFAFNNVYLKILGYLFIHLWFILDCSDGEVARITRIFSKMGKELDYVAHLINHPMFGMSFAVSTLQLSNRVVSDCFVIVVFSLLIIFNLIGRGLMNLHLVYNIKNNVSNNSYFSDRLNKKILISYIMKFFCQFPNIAIIFPMLYFFDLYYGTIYSFYYVIITTIITMLAIMRMAYITIIKFYRI